MYLRAFQDCLACVTAGRGQVLLAAMQRDGDRISRRRTYASAAGVLRNAVRPHAVRLMPPLTMPAEEIDEAADRPEEALTPFA